MITSTVLMRGILEGLLSHSRCTGNSQISLILQILLIPGERPYKCHLSDCGRAFIQLSNLQQHLRNHDAQVERAKNRPFHCNICGKGFATESSLRTHTSKVGFTNYLLIEGGFNVNWEIGNVSWVIKRS